MFLIKNTTRDLAFIGLYPGDSKKVVTLDAEMKKLSKAGLLNIQDLSIKKETKTSKEDEVQK